MWKEGERSWHSLKASLQPNYRNFLFSLFTFSQRALIIRKQNFPWVERNALLWKSIYFTQRTKNSILPICENLWTAWMFTFPSPCNSSSPLRSWAQPSLSYSDTLWIMQQRLHLHPSFSFYLHPAGEWWGGKESGCGLHLPPGDGTRVKLLKGLCVCVCVCPPLKYISLQNVQRAEMLKNTASQKKKRLLQWHHLAHTTHCMNSASWGHHFWHTHTHTQTTSCRTASSHYHTTVHVRTPSGHVPAPVSCFRLLIGQAQSSSEHIY